MSSWGKQPAAKATATAWASRTAAPSSTPSPGAYVPPAKVQEMKEKTQMKVVQIDGLVLLKIIKHCTQSLPELCSGSLLGLDVDNSLEVTNCFPFPVNGEDDPEYDGANYQSDMVKLMRDVNVDHNSVGWYRSSYMGSFCTQDVIDSQFAHQQELDQDLGQKSVVLIFDPFQSTKGKLAIKAYRLREEFMVAYKQYKESNQSCPLNLEEESVLEEIPIEITNSELVSVFLNDIKSDKSLDTSYDSLDLSSSAYLEKNLEFMLDELDSLALEQNKQQQFQRQLHKQKQQQNKWLLQRRAENAAREERHEPLLPETDPSLPMFKPLPNPSLLESLLIRNQMGVYCNQVNTFAAGGVNKLFLASGVQGN